ncbi:MAG: hypothetical protein COA42_03030 [Alteromonadaceae bacterium]|nr:MAG: hypothetical protein COA42_03030 [Alteromonadaceae bacterium]
MNKYEDQYYIVFKKYDEHTLYLASLQKTADRDYEYEKLDLGDEPLYFENAYKEQDKTNPSPKKIGQFHMNMDLLIVHNEIREKLKDFKIDNFQLYPSVIIDDEGQLHDNYWYFSIYKEFDCVDYENSEIRNYEENVDDHKIRKYIFSEEAMDNIPEERRLIFRPMNMNIGHTIIHKKIVNIFKQFDTSALNLVKVSEWHAGTQFR